MGALIPLALSLAPEIAKWIFGDSGEQTVAAVTKAVATVTGTTDDKAARQALAGNPSLADQLRLQLAQVAAQAEQAARQAELDTITAHLHDTADARAQTIALAQAHSPVQWSAAVISFLVLATFGVVMWTALTHVQPPGSETLLNMLMGTLAAMASSTVSYWVGSSAGSAQKTDLLYRSSPAPMGPRTGAKS